LILNHQLVLQVHVGTQTCNKTRKRALLVIFICMTKKLNERGLPSVGGVSPGDSSNNLGQARRPWNLTGSSGGHSQSADSGFSSKLGRVNKGRDDDKYAWQVRFPENEEEPEEDTYNMKLRSKISIDLRGRKPMPERKLTTDIDQLIEENEKFNEFLNLNTVSERSDGNTSRGFLGHVVDDAFDTVVDMAGDTARQFVGTVIPGAADFLFVLKNIKELQNNSEAGKELISLYNEQGSYKRLGGSYLNEIDDVIDNIVTDLSDVIEAFVSIIPAGGDVAGYIATLTSWAAKIKKTLDPLLKQASRVPGAKTKMGKELTLRLAGNVALRSAIFELDEKFDEETPFWGSIIDSVKVAGTLSDIVSNFDELYKMSDDGYEKMSSTEKLALIRKANKLKRLISIPVSIDDIDSSVYGFEELHDETDISESKIRSLISQILLESEELIDEDLVEAEYADEVEEASGVGSIGGYAGPMASPANQEEFNKKMQKVSFPD